MCESRIHNGTITEIWDTTKKSLLEINTGKYRERRFSDAF